MGQPVGAKGENARRTLPCTNDKDDTERLLSDEAGEASLLLDGDVLERLLGDADHVRGTVLEAVDLTGRLGSGAAHLKRQLLGDLVLLGHKGVDKLLAVGHTLRHCVFF